MNSTTKQNNTDRNYGASLDWHSRDVVKTKRNPFDDTSAPSPNGEPLDGLVDISGVERDETIGIDPDIGIRTSKVPKSDKKHGIWCRCWCSIKSCFGFKPKKPKNSIKKTIESQNSIPEQNLESKLESDMNSNHSNQSNQMSANNGFGFQHIINNNEEIESKTDIDSNKVMSDSEPLLKLDSNSLKTESFVTEVNKSLTFI